VIKRSYELTIKNEELKRRRTFFKTFQVNYLKQNAIQIEKKSEWERERESESE